MIEDVDWHIIDAGQGVECRTYVDGDGAPRAELRWPDGALRDLSWDEFDRWRGGEAL